MMIIVISFKIIHAIIVKVVVVISFNVLRCVHIVQVVLKRTCGRLV